MGPKKDSDRKWFRFSNKSVFEQPLGMNYVRQPRFHCIFYLSLPMHRIRDSQVGIATGYRLGYSGPCRGKIFLLFTSSRPALGPTNPTIQLVPGALSPGVKRQRHEVDHLPPTSAVVKNTWICISTPQKSLWRSA
jgi:hypothetical protein